MTDDVLIVGGGIGGITAALEFARAGFAVRVFEQSSEIAEIGAGIQLSPNCTRVLHELGLAVALAEVAYLPEGTEIRHWKSGKMLSANPLGQQVIDTYGVPYYHVHRADLMQVLVAAATADPHISLHTNTEILAVEQDSSGVSVRPCHQSCLP